jgi:hypothetical protein
MWRILTIIFQTIISIFTFLYFRKSNNFVTLVYNREFNKGFKSFIKFSWVVGFFSVLGITIRLFLDIKSLNPQDKSYEFHNLVSTNANYLKLALDQKIKFLISMLIISALIIFFYNLIFISLLLPFRTVILAILTQISGIDFAGLIENITQVYIPSFNFWLTETFGLNAPQIPNHSPMSIEDINRINEINQLNSEIVRLNESVNSFISSKETDSLTNSLTHNTKFNSSDAKPYINSIRAELVTTTIILFTVAGVCLISSGLIYFDSGAYVYASIAHTVHSTGNIIYNTFHSTGSLIYNTGASIYNSIAGLFHSASVSGDLIDPNTPSGSSGISKYFGPENNPVSPSSSSSAASTSTVKPGAKLFKYQLFELKYFF